ncbi:MAG: fibronectin type III-like domain-contianing protein, partial [Muribaculaceae bacterium]|nr:fibronectin type III-like domain-contianing protein [Muribaculaceae bacterium]
YGPLCYLYSAEKDPRVAWEFGYGKSYTTFAYDNLTVDQDASTASEGIKVTFDVKNTGSVKGDEIAQVYLSPGEDNQNIRPIKLQGFARVSLEPGETKKVQVTLYPDQFGYYTHDGQRQWNIDPGKYTVKIGASSQDIRLQEDITLKGDKITKPIRDQYFSEAHVI